MKTSLFTTGRKLALAGAVCLTAGCLTVAAVSALADPPSPASDQGAPNDMNMMPPMGGPGFHRSFDDLDANKDGKIDRTEFNRPPPDPFDRMDTNHDGTISKDEFDAFKPHVMMFRFDGQPPPDGMEGMDDGPDGGHGQRMERRIIMRMGPPDLKALDTNGDGKVSFDEFAAPMKDHFNQLDANHDGSLSDDELKGDMPPPPQGR